VTVNRTGNDLSPSNRSPALTTELQVRVRRSGRKRFLWAGVVALVGLILLVVLGPDEKVIKERFEYYGAPGELEIMPEISIDDGHQNIHQLPKSLQVQPPPSNIEVEREEPTEEGTEEIPPESLQEPNQVTEASEFPRENAELSSEQQVEMALPMQTNPDFYLLHHVLPEYPLAASETERRTPVIQVFVAIWVDPDGIVQEAWVTRNDGGRHFEIAALEAVRQWRFGWRVDPGIGRQMHFPFRFKSTYFTPGRIGQ
jgi:TonB family protein